MKEFSLAFLEYKMPLKKLVFSEEAVFEAINNQIKGDDPAETKQAYDRLMKEMRNHDEVMEYLGVVMKSEILETLSPRGEGRSRQIAGERSI
jgi:hypothetical protein